jgi:hypothetical protein
MSIGSVLQGSSENAGVGEVQVIHPPAFVIDNRHGADSRDDQSPMLRPLYRLSDAIQARRVAV